MPMEQRKRKITIWRLRGSYISSVVSIALVLFLLGFMGFLILNARKLSEYVRENIGFAVILNSQVKEIDILRLQKILDAKPYVKTTEYVSKAEAAKNLQEELGEDFVEFLGYNPLLSSIEVQLHADFANLDSIRHIEQELKTYSEVKEIYYQRRRIQAVNKNVKWLSFFILIISGMFLFISIALINNTIRLSVYAKRFLINTMKLVGASWSFIQRPFLISGLIQGLFGGLIAIMLLIGTIYLVKSEMQNVLTVQSIGLLFIGIIVLSVLISVASTYFAVKRYLRFRTDELYF